MDGATLSREDFLVDAHLDRLAEDERAWLENELDRDAELTARYHRLGRTLQPLDHWSVSPGSGALADRVLTAVRAESRARSIAPDAEPSRAQLVGSLIFRFREMLAAAACVAILFGVIVPGLSGVRERSRQALCANHLGSLFFGTSVYQEMFAGALPYTGNMRNAAWLPSAPAERPYASNSRHVFLLVKLGLGPKPADFVCPSDRAAEPMIGIDFSEHEDFLSACNISYDSLNLSGLSPNLRPANPVAYMGDPNPLFVQARFNDEIDPDTTNSPAHLGRGQTVLVLDGSTRWQTTPLFGNQRDNIWLAGDIRRYAGYETPAGEDDVHLIPGYPADECGRGGNKPKTY
jgi:hypothetical protein